ncbi:MAG: hypothetical protein H0V17_31315, partial [Deltaproteobacteria bacterium]|nr:hypothetical protein [Deltaproteobacteria bacterium]
MIVATSQRLEEVEPRSLIPTDDLRRAKRWAFAALAVNVALLAIVPRFVFGGWRAMLSPPVAQFDGAQLSAVPLVGDLEARLE